MDVTNRWLRTVYLRWALAGLAVVGPAVHATAQTIQLVLEDRQVVGKPLAWDEQRVLVVQPDGQAVEVASSDVTRYSLLGPSFQPYTPGQMRGALLREFGRRFEVSGAGTYLVVHPVGQRHIWVEPFEQLYRSMYRYFSVRGFPVQSPEFPLAAIVFPTREEFFQYVQSKQLGGVSSEALGLYVTRSNRILMYDVTAGRPEQQDWRVNADTIIHETAHQTAFNLHIHRRFTQTPLWAIEGLGTMFEARGVWNWSEYRHLKDRVNNHQLQTFRDYANTTDSLEVLLHQIQGDRLFRENSELAYAHAWSLVFFLTEQEPRKFASYLGRLGALNPLEDYPAPRRLADFTAEFGTDLRLLDARMKRFLQGL